jgi:hypothetical protein
MSVMTSRHGAGRTRGEWIVWVLSLGLVPLLALGGAFVLVRARHGGPVSTPSDVAVGFLEYWATPVCGVVLGRAHGLRWPKLILLAVIGVGAVAVWFYVVFVVLVTLGVWVQPSPD